ncbi:hypothetical protein ABZX90_37075 [Streptomyces sp. NPDC002935]|uniref:hypothetical protein n=1 Tax=Streptomyces sp. NPDC002935 TaxID=3154545 RepID=UPI00339DD404
MTREERLAQFEAECAQQEAEYNEREAEMLRLLEWKRIEKTLAGLYRARYAGDKTILTAQRIDRFERLQQCLLGSPAALAG